MPGSNLAELPTAGYPALNFFGATGLTPQIQRGFQASKSVAKPTNRLHVLIIVLVLAGLGYALFHYNEVR